MQTQGKKRQKEEPLCCTRGRLMQAGVAACAVGAMTSLLLLVIVYTEETMERQAERPIS